MIKIQLPDQSNLTQVSLTQAQVDDLLEYSLSIPTGKFIGKQWKRRCDDGGWARGEYVEHSDPNLVGIEWRQIQIVELEGDEK